MNGRAYISDHMMRLKGMLFKDHPIAFAPLKKFFIIFLSYFKLVIWYEKFNYNIWMNVDKINFVKLILM